jgi:murein DD-endopeptidase MepM/ murein hydrolase activator NlpD
MLFRSRERWWAGGGGLHKPRHRRKAPHEGIDLFLYLDEHGAPGRLAAGTIVPAVYGGIIRTAVPDYLGSTVVVEHPRFVRPDDGRLFCTIYSHIDPVAGGGPDSDGAGDANGRPVEEGEIIGTVSPVEAPPGMHPHLHLSAAWVTPGTDYARFDWRTLRPDENYELIDPLPLVTGREAW